MGKRIISYVILLMSCGYVYVCLELIFRGKSDVTMMFCASLAALPMLLLNNIFSFELDFIIQILICGGFATFIEYLFGILFNKDYHIWDYRNLPGNIDGLICPQFFLVWLGLSAIMILILDYLEYVVFDGPRPYYKIFGHKIWMKDKNMPQRERR